MLRDAPLLLLDEPTANLDTVTERELLASVWETTRDRAVLLITHRLVEMEEMDEILVMNAGRVVERGTHEELTRWGGLYHRMLETQRELLAEPRLSSRYTFVAGSRKKKIRDMLSTPEQIAFEDQS
jgi:ABC-type multidrug transport system fused ATPase/permease subunit